MTQRRSSKKFYAEVGPSVVSLCVSGHMPRDFIRLSEQMNIFIAEDSGKRVGFFSIKRTGHDSAEIPFIYFDLMRTNFGYGRKCIAYIDDWIRANWNDVRRIYLDTIIPVYNGGFYEKMGYKETGESFCVYSDCKVKARRYEKRLRKRVGNPPRDPGFAGLMRVRRQINPFGTTRKARTYFTQSPAHPVHILVYQ